MPADKAFAAMVLLSSLPKELLQLVLSFTDQQSLGRISIASRQWNALSVPILYKQPLFEVWDQFDLFARAVLSNRTVTAHSSRILPRLGLLVQEIDLVNVPHRWERLMVARAESLVQQWTNIIHLDLEFCARIGNTVAIAISNSCPKLQTLSLSKCTKITDEGIAAIAKCIHLISLDASCLPRVSDLSIVHICTLLLNLEFLNIAATRITDKSVTVALKKLVKLSYLDVSSCFNIHNPQLFVDTAPERIEVVIDSIDPGETEWLDDDLEYDHDWLEYDEEVFTD